MASLVDGWEIQLGQLLSVAFAMLLGGIIGAERELRGRPAGFRTHMLVAGAAALLLGLTDPLVTRFVDERYADVLRVDPIRIIEAVVTAVAFIGAGSIIQHARKEAVIGLTTAASLLIAAASGIAVGLRQYVLAFGVALLSVLVLRALGAVDRLLSRSGDRPPSGNSNSSSSD